MTAKTGKLSDQDISELENALAVARCACAFIKSKTNYASDLYDAVDDVIKACNKAEKEAYNAP